jgi:hypothetical protein
MKFILSWEMRPEKLQETINYWFTAGDQLPAGVTHVARYHRADLSGGIHIVESNDAAAVAQYLAQWADKLDLEATAVIEDADAVTAYSKIAGVKPKAQGATS